MIAAGRIAFPLFELVMTIEACGTAAGPWCLFWALSVAISLVEHWLLPSPLLMPVFALARVAASRALGLPPFRARAGRSTGSVYAEILETLPRPADDDDSSPSADPGEGGGQ